MFTGTLLAVAERRSGEDDRVVGYPITGDGAVRCVDHHPRENVLLVGRDDGSTTLWELPRVGAELVLAHRAGVQGVSFSPDGRTVVSGAVDGTVRLWDASTGEPIGEPMRHGRNVIYVVFDPRGRLVASGGVDRTVRLWDTTTQRQVGPSLEHPAVTTGLAFCPDGRELLTGCDDGIARIWDVENGTLLRETERHGRHRVYAVRFDEKGTRFATGAGEDVPPTSGELNVWDTSTLTRLTGPLPHDGVVYNARFHAGGSRLVTACSDKRVRFWDVETGDLLGSPLHHPGIAYHAVLDPAKSYLVTTCGDGRARFWDLPSRRPFGPHLVHDDVMIGLDVSGDGSRIVTGGIDGSARVWRGSDRDRTTNPRGDRTRTDGVGRTLGTGIEFCVRSDIGRCVGGRGRSMSVGARKRRPRGGSRGRRSKSSVGSGPREGRGGEPVHRGGDYPSRLSTWEGVWLAIARTEIPD